MTSFLATTMTLKERELTAAMDAVSLMEGVRRAVRFGIPLASAVRAASAAPAAAAGLDAGVLTRGRPADLVLLDRELNIQAVFIDGRKMDTLC